MNKTMELFKHQIEGIEWLKARERAILADEPGLGKTYQAIISMGDTNNGSTLIVCPASLKTNWQREINSIYQWDEVAIVNGTKPDPKDMAWIVINYDILKYHEEWLQEKIDKKEISGIIFDEAHYLKTPKSDRTKSAKKLVKNIERVQFLTGTPILNRPAELYMLLKMIKHPIASDYRSFTERYCGGYMRVFWKTVLDPETNQYEKRRFQFWDASGATNVPELHEKIKPIMLRREKRNVLDLPEKVRNIKYLDLSPEWREIYKNAFDAYIESIQEDEEKNIENIMMSRQLVELNKTQQICSQAKIDYICDHAEQILETDQVVIFCKYKATLNKYVEKLKKYGTSIIDGTIKQDERQKAVDDFQSGKNKVFIGNIMASGVGITLTKSQTVIFADVEWTPALLDQAEDRTHRIGQTGTVNVYYYVYKDTVEEDILHLLGKKQEIIRAIMKGEKARRNAISIIRELGKKSARKL